MTPKIKKILERVTDNYTLRLEHGSKLTGVPDAKMNLVDEFNGTAFETGTAPGSGSSSVSRPIGFGYRVNGKVYEHFQVSRDGYMILSQVPEATTVESRVLSARNPPTFMISANPNDSYVVLGPWVARQRLISNTPRGGYVSALHNRALLGYERAHSSLVYDEVEYGVRYYTENSSEGRRLIVRWNTYTFLNDGKIYRLRYEVVLYESGRVEYRYCPKPTARNNFSLDDASDGEFTDHASIVFLTGNIGRDFGATFRVGGSTYDMGGKKIDASTPYVQNLSPGVDWPAKKHGKGSKFVFLPPMPAPYDLRNIFQLDTHDSHRGGAFAEASSFSNLQSSTFASPFTENDPAQIDVDAPFYKFASNPEAYESILSSNLRQKDRISLTLPVNIPLLVRNPYRSMYYYDTKNKQFVFPPAATFESPTGSSYDTINSGSLSTQNWIEPMAFDGVGNYTYHINSFVPDLGWIFGHGYYTTGSLARALAYDNPPYPSYPPIGNFTTLPLFDPSDECLFELPITEPFIIEKATITMTVAANDAWATARSSYGGPRAVRGPAVTFALLHQEKNDAGTYRNLILSGTITNTDDGTVGKLRGDAPTGNTFYYVNTGFPSLGGNPSIMLSSTGTDITSSIRIETEAAIDTGTSVIISRWFDTNARQQMDDFLAQETIVLDNSTDPVLNARTIIHAVSPFGRSKTGFDVNQRSVYGKEFVSTFTPVIKNSFKDQPTEGDVWTSPFTTTYLNVSFAQHTNVKSPYMALPGDKFLFMASAAPDPLTSTPRFQVMPGDIKIDIYGSYVVDGGESKHRASTNIDSDVVYHVIGDEPTLDQFVGAHRKTYVGTIGDTYVEGVALNKRLTSDAVDKLSAGSTFVTSKTLSSNVSLMHPTDTIVMPAPRSGLSGTTTALPDMREISKYTVVNTFKRLSYVARKMSTRCGMSNISRHVSSSERFYDSLIPSFGECAKIDNIQMALNTDTNIVQVTFVWIRDNIFASPEAFDNGTTWLTSFPFEPRYAGVTLLQDLKNAFTVSQGVSFAEPDGFPLSFPTTASNIGLDIKGTDVTDGWDIFFGLNELDNVYYGWTAASAEDNVRMLYGLGGIQAAAPSLFLGAHRYGRGKTFDYAYRTASVKYGIAPIIAGWKYGLRSGFAEYTSAYWRTDRFGQMRDMLEQRPYSKFMNAGENTVHSVSDPVVSVQFVNIDGQTTAPQNTWSSNLTRDAVSVVPFFDGQSRNREAINVNALGTSIVSLNDVGNGNTTI